MDVQSLTESPSGSPRVIGGPMPLTKRSSVQLKDEHMGTLKVIIVGEPHTGKTSLLKSYVEKDFCFTYEETVSSLYMCIYKYDYVKVNACR